MKKTVVRFGIYGFILAFTFFLCGLYGGQSQEYSVKEAIGYAAIIVSLSFVYFGIRHFRDDENQGKLGIRRGVLLGLLISACTSGGIAVADFIYTTAINPDFFLEYREVMIAEGYKGDIPDYGSALMAVIMFLTAMMIGLIISLISALLLQRK